METMGFFRAHSHIAIGLILLAAPAAAHAQTPFGEGPVFIEADTMTHEAAGDRIEATGNVRIRGAGMTLLSDSAFVLGEKEEAEARGNVTLLRDGDTLRGDRLTLNLRNETGVVENGNLFVGKGNIHLRAKRMYKLGPEDYRLERGSFTTCDGDSPSWKFSASEVDVTVGEYATGKNALFYIKDVPVFYFPYLVFPVKRERQSGFLTPRGGNSSKKGITFNLAYYWAITPSQDATVTLDVQTKRGVGLGLDYRYIRKTGSEGTFRGFGIYDTDQQRFRGDMSQKHLETVSDTFDIKSDINLVTDRNYYRDFAEQNGVYNRNSLESSLSATKHFGRYVLAGEVRYVEDLREEVANNRRTLQKLPTISLTGVRQRIAATPLFFSLDSSFTNFYRTEGLRGQRLDLHPVVTAYTKPLGPLELSAWGGYRQRLYTANGADAGEGYHGSGLLTGGGAISSTLSRVYETGSAAMPRVQHVMIPQARYSYVQEKDQETLPFFDFHDRIVSENRIVYSLTNSFTARFDRGDEPPEYREILSLRLAQGYDFSGARRDLLTLVDEGRPFTDVMLQATARPHKKVSLTLDTRYNPYHSRLSTVAVSADAEDGKGNAAGFSYRHARDEVEYLEGRAAIAMVKPFLFSYTGRYSFDRKDFLESLYALEYRHQCWSVTFSYRDRLDNREFFINFTLAGIGSLGSIRAF